VALDLALAKAGKSMPAKIAMMAMTTSNSMRVKPAEIERPALLRGELEMGFMRRVSTMESQANPTAEPTPSS
jgi:hypothetical protein